MAGLPMSTLPTRDFPMRAIPSLASLRRHAWAASLARPVSPAGSLACALVCSAFLFCGLSRADDPRAAPVAPALEAANRALQEGQADEAVRRLQATLGADPGNGSAHLLLCRVYLSEELGGEAAGECQTALRDGLDQDSEAQDWTGRALGQQAAHAGMLTGLKLARGVRIAFETAVYLNPASEAASVDLGEFYTGAPAVVGGGTAKALALAARIGPALPETAHRIRAMAAEENKDFGAAEREFQAEATVAHRAGALIDLAAFYGRRGEEAQAIDTAQRTLAADPAADATVVEAAGVLSDAGQPAAAEAALRAYLAHGEHSERAPVFRVRTLLGALLAKSGQGGAARIEYEAALAMASRYAPARKGLASL